MERQDTEYTVTEQCELLGISRSGIYYVPTVSERKLDIMNYMDEIYTDDPTSGQRKIQAELENTYGIKAGRDLIARSCARWASAPSIRGPARPCPSRYIGNIPTCFVA